jgi:hypothetical protein
MIETAISHPSTSDDAISACERMLGRYIPQPYRAFLKTQNGGRPAHARDFAYLERDGRRRTNAIDQFIGVHEGESGFEELWQFYSDRIPLDTIPIATALGSNLVLMGTTGANAGRIFYWDHNFEYEAGEAPGYRNVHPLADSLEAFLASLTE